MLSQIKRLCGRLFQNVNKNSRTTDWLRLWWSTELGWWWNCCWVVVGTERRREKNRSPFFFFFTWTTHQGGWCRARGAIQHGTAAKIKNFRFLFCFRVFFCFFFRKRCAQVVFSLNAWRLFTDQSRPLLYKRCRCDSPYPKLYNNISHLIPTFWVYVSHGKGLMDHFQYEIYWTRISFLFHTC